MVGAGGVDEADVVALLTRMKTVKATLAERRAAAGLVACLPTRRPGNGSAPGKSPPAMAID